MLCNCSIIWWVRCVLCEKLNRWNEMEFKVWELRYYFSAQPDDVYRCKKCVTWRDQLFSSDEWASCCNCSVYIRVIKPFFDSMKRALSRYGYLCRPLLLKLHSAITKGDIGQN